MIAAEDDVGAIFKGSTVPHVARARFAHTRAGGFCALKGFYVRVPFNFTHVPGIYFYKEDNPPDSSWLLPTVREIYGNPVPLAPRYLILNTNLTPPSPRPLPCRL
jgi:hypothetical protein